MALSENPPDLLNVRVIQGKGAPAEEESSATETDPRPGGLSGFLPSSLSETYTHRVICIKIQRTIDSFMLEISTFIYRTRYLDES